jgi:eukaryotic-like serine/threonine-protein kinase
VVDFCHFLGVVMSEVDGVAKNTSPEFTATRSSGNETSGADATFDTSASTAFAAAERASQVKSIGPYQLIRKLGEGGMGQVWLAEQTAPIKRQVALKLIKVGRYDESVLQRFYAERQSLAMMDHPSIAKVFDAGATPDGQPYFVMEYVPGQPITAYCDRKRLKIRERLELFIKVCEGVQHAHQKAIMHRDLKPANILVVEVDGKPVPRIIDFGLAKAASPQLDGETLALMTQAGGWVGTPGYMSPEQADAGVMDVDTRTDVYSLGAVLYVLLTGSLPFETSKQRVDEFLRRLREEDPLRPSSKVSGNKETSKSSAEARGAEPKQLVTMLHGDLDWITMKALEKDRARRYGSPMELAADIGRYLGNEPVSARPASVGYRAKKYVLRHTALVAAAAAVFLVLVAGVITSTWQAVKARRAEAQAKQQSAIAQAVNDFLRNDLLAQASSSAQSGLIARPDPDLKVRTALDRAAERIEGKFAKQPEVEAAIRNTIGETYTDLAIYPEAAKQLERAVDLSRRVLGPEHPDTLTATNNLAMIYRDQGKYPAAEALESRTLEARRRVLGPEHPDTLTSMNNLAIIYDNEGKYAQSEALASQTLEIRRRVLGPEHPDTLPSMSILAAAYNNEGKFPQAEGLYSQGWEIRRRVLGPEHPGTLMAMYNLADVYWHEGKDAQSEALQNQTLDLRRRVLGPEHRDTLASMSELALVYDDEGKHAQAEALHTRIVDIEGRVFGPEHPDTLTSKNNLAAVYEEEGKSAQAEALFSQILGVERRVLGPEHRNTIVAMGDLGVVYSEEGKYAQAEALFSQALELGRRVLGPEHPYTLSCLGDFSFMYQRQGKYALAETYGAQALAGRRHALGSEHPDTMESVNDLALAYVSQGKAAESEPLAREALELYQKQAPDDWQRFRAESLLGATLAGEKKYAEAEPLLLKGYQGMRARRDHIDAPDRYYLERAHLWLVQFYKNWGKPEKAAAIAKESD